MVNMTLVLVSTLAVEGDPLTAIIASRQRRYRRKHQK